MSTPRLRKPRSFDDESLKPRGWSFESSASSTAPLPSTWSFTGLTPKQLGGRIDGIGKRERDRGADEVNGPHARIESRNEYPSGAGGIAGVLESVQAVVEFIASRLAKMGHDEATNGAEAGLLLSVEDMERESAVAVVGEC